MAKMPSMTASPVWAAPVNANDDPGSDTGVEPAAPAPVPLVTVAVVDVVHGVEDAAVVEVVDVDEVLEVDDVLDVDDVLEADDVDVVGAEDVVVAEATHGVVVVGPVDEDVVEEATVDEVDDDVELDVDEDDVVEVAVVVVVVPPELEPCGAHVNPAGSELLRVN